MKIEKCVLQELLQVLGKVVRSESVVEEYKSVCFVGIPGSFQVEAYLSDNDVKIRADIDISNIK